MPEDKKKILPEEAMEIAGQLFLNMAEAQRSDDQITKAEWLDLVYKTAQDAWEKYTN